MGFKSAIRSWLGVSEAPVSTGGGGAKRDPKQSIIKKLALVVGGANGRDFSGPEFDLNQINKAYNTESYVRVACDKYIELMFKAGWDFIGDNAQTVEYIKTRFKLMAEATQIPTEQLFIEMSEDVVKYSNTVVAKARIKNGQPLPKGIKIQGIAGAQPVAGYFPLNMLTVSVQRDQFGAVKAWQQESQGAGGQKPVKFRPEDIVHIYYRRDKGYAFGQSFLFPVLDDIRALRQAEENVLRLIYRNLYPFHHIQVGTQEEPADDPEVDDVRVAIEGMELEGGLITSERVNIKPIAADQIIDAKPYLEYFERRVFTGLAVPETLMGRGGAANRGTSDNMTTDFIDRCKAMQTVIAAFINEFMIKELLMEGGMDPVLNVDDEVKFVFKEIDLDAQIKYENQAVYLYEHNSLDQNEMRARLGYDPLVDDSFMFLNIVSIPMAVAQAEAKAAAAPTGTSTSPAAKPNAPKPKSKAGSKSPKKPVQKKQRTAYEEAMFNEYELLGEGLKIIAKHYFDYLDNPRSDKRNDAALIKDVTLTVHHTEQRLNEVTQEFNGTVSLNTQISIRRMLSQIHDTTIKLLMEMQGSNRLSETSETISSLFRVLDNRLTDITEAIASEKEVDELEQ